MSDPVTRLNAALEGRYTIERELGEGGMATVYLAKDLKHNRNVALKVLEPVVAAVVGADRFLAEIETTTQPHSSACPTSARLWRSRRLLVLVLGYFHSQHLLTAFPSAATS